MITIASVGPYRAYTVPEIDRLRKATREWYGLYSNFDATELEERVRTFMTAGTPRRRRLNAACESAHA
jgi:hypothetical protein